MTDVTGTTSTTAVAKPVYSYQGGAKVSEDKTTLGNKDFLQLLIKQLQHQDPSSPMDSNAIMQQTATLSSTQTMQQMITVQQEQFALQSRMSASSFVGQTVTFTGADGKAATGLVSSATFAANGTPTLRIGSADVGLSSVTGISLPTTASTATSGSTDQTA